MNTKKLLSSYIDVETHRVDTILAKPSSMYSHLFSLFPDTSNILIIYTFTSLFPFIFIPKSHRSSFLP